jgi:hypothetical protein
MRRTRVLGLVLVLLIAAAAVSVALAASSGKQPAKPHAKPARAGAAAQPQPARRASAVSGKASRPAKAHRRATPAVSRAAVRAGGDNPGENTGADPDNVQQGDQSGPADNAQGGESESTPGDASVDHVEQPAGADHQCPSDCAPGEQP